MEKVLNVIGAIIGAGIILFFACLFLLIGGMAATAGFTLAPMLCVVVSVVVAYHAIAGAIEQIKLN